MNRQDAKDAKKRREAGGKEDKKIRKRVAPAKQKGVPRGTFLA
jgi:hypothetical protein